MKKPCMNSDKPLVLIIGPLPPPYGGVATFIENQSKQMALLEKYNLSVYRTGKRKKSTSVIKQVILEICHIFRFLISHQVREAKLIHIHTASYLSFYRNVPYILIAKYFSKSKVILHIHGARFHLFYNNSNKIIKKIISASIKKAEKTIVTSPLWLPIMKDIVGDCSTVISLSNAFDKNQYYPMVQEDARKTLGLPPDENIILNIGNLEEYKGHRYLIESISHLSKKMRIRLYIIGSGPLEHQLKKTIEEYNLEDSVFLAGGNKPLDELPIWINSCDLFVLSSLNEGNPIVMFECLGCGRPFVGTKVGGIPEVITSEEYGLLCEPRDPVQLSATIEAALNMKWNADAITTHAEKYTWHQVANELVDIYDSLLQIES